MKPGKHVSVQDDFSLLNIFGQLDKDSDVIVQSCCCSQALLSENTGIYGCRLLESECPYETPDPRRCVNSLRFSAYEKQGIFIPQKAIRRKNLRI